ncbi:MAG: nicotinate (nicotinamide) nucleotide adenylyltransferase [bacterium]
MKIGLFGGTFDPIHCAHLIIAQFIKEELDINKLIFIPSGIPPHKEVYLPAEQRLKMVQLSIEASSEFECSLIEIEARQTTYTVDTVKKIKSQLNVAKEDLYLIIGADNFIELSKWKSPEELFELCQVVVFPRHKITFESGPPEFQKKAIYLKQAPIIEISSTQIRSLIMQSRSIKYFVPPAVEAYIKSFKLYS